MQQIVEIPIGSIKEYERNARINDKAVDKVKESIKEFGFQSPIILDKNKTIIAGHTRLKAAKELGYKKVPCIIAENLTPTQVKAFRLADNKTAEIAEWDYDILPDELKALSECGYDLELIGFTSAELDEIIGGTISSTEEHLQFRIDGQKQDESEEETDFEEPNEIEENEKDIEYDETVIVKIAFNSYKEWRSIEDEIRDLVSNMDAHVSVKMG